MRKRNVMPTYRIDHALGKELWWIESRESNNHSLSINTVYEVTLKIATSDLVPGEAVWVDQPNPLAAFSHALMLFNGETK
jgi:hypothetical protein